MMFEGEHVIWLRGGEICAYRMTEDEYVFVVRVTDSGSTHAYTRPFEMAIRNGWPHLKWRLSNKQVVGLPINEEALKDNGVEYLVNYGHVGGKGAGG